MEARKLKLTLCTSRSRCSRCIPEITSFLLSSIRTKWNLTYRTNVMNTQMKQNSHKLRAVGAEYAEDGDCILVEEPLTSWRSPSFFLSFFLSFNHSRIQYENERLKQTHNVKQPLWNNLFGRATSYPMVITTNPNQNVNSLMTNPSDEASRRSAEKN